MSSPSGHLLINRTPRGSVIPSTLPALDNLTREQLIEWIHKLKRECTSLDEKGIFLAFSHAHPHTYTCTQRTADAIRRERDQLATSMDAEEEQISNRLMRKVSELREEKERLAQQVEREEEMLTNTLQKQMTALRQEKVDLENTLEAEEEQITNRMVGRFQSSPPAFAPSSLSSSAPTPRLPRCVAMRLATAAPPARSIPTRRRVMIDSPPKFLFNKIH
jgi:hypothetical protein